MNMPLPLTSLRSYIASEFSALRTRALRNNLWAKLIGKNTKLSTFPEGTFQTGPNRRSLGTMDIQVNDIVGTLYRHSDFDHQFRPLKKNLRDRWINIYLLQQNEGWPPILVHKVGEHYYVEDGHHRVSVARNLGILFIQAKVWDYPVQTQQAKKCDNVDCPARKPIKKYVVSATD